MNSEAPIGIKIVYHPRSHGEAEVDIVAVHGIGARPDRSWSYKTQDNNKLDWLSDENMLPANVPNARILAFGYKSAWFGNDVSHTSLSGLARSLRNCLEFERRHCPKRPIIFIAHCFGGLIVVSALVETPQTFFDNTIGVIFLGTPFSGANDKFPKMVKNLERISPKLDVLKDILEYLKKDNGEVKEAIRRLKRLKEHSPNNLPRIHCVYETQESDIATVVRRSVGAGSFLVPKIKIHVVDSKSAYLGVGEAHDFQLDHFQLNKFGSQDDTHFKQICQMLWDILPPKENLLSKETLLPNEIGHFMRIHERTNSQGSIPLQIIKTVSDDDETRPSDDVQGPKDKLKSNEFQPNFWKELRLPEFDHHGMIPEKFEMEIQHPPGLNRFSNEYREWRKRRAAFVAVAAGLSLDCKYVFLRNRSTIRIFTVNDFKNYNGTKKYPGGRQHDLKLANGKTEEIRFVCLGITICAFVTSTRCCVWDFNHSQQPKTIRSLPDSNLCEYRCIAIHEAEDINNTILLAIGMENTQGLEDEGMVRLLEFRPNDLADSKELHGKEIAQFALEDQKTDYPKTLSFSRDGSILTCTGQKNQVHAWRINPAGSSKRVETICQTTRPCKSGVGAKGITSAISWLTAKQHPYIICTTVPSTDRKNSVGGEWTFMSPLSIPLPSADDSPLYHCFLQIQGLGTKHLKIHAAAISPQGNIIAFLDSNGRICLIPIQRQHRGGLESNNSIPPIEVGKDLSIGDNEQLRGDLRFNSDGTKLFAVTGKSGVEVSFPNVIPWQQPRPQLRPIQPRSPIATDRPPQLPPLPFTNSPPSSPTKSNLLEGALKVSLVDNDLVIV